MKLRHHTKKPSVFAARIITGQAAVATCILSLAACLFASCIDYEDVSKPVSTSIQLVMPAEFTKGSDLQGHVVTISHNGTTLTATTDEQGKTVFNDLIPDVYDISTSWDISGEKYHELTGEEIVASGWNVSGSLNAQLISEEQQGTTIMLPTQAAVKRDIVIGKIASAGSKDANNRTYAAGKYLELYNQSDNDVDVSGLYIGLLDSSNPQPYTLENLHDDYADSVVLVKQVFRIPDDKPYMVKSGGTVILTNSAIDHSDVSAFEQDLSEADFEAKDESGKTVNNPATPALITTFTTSGGNATMNLVQGGPCGIIIFRTNENPTDWKRTYPYGKEKGILYLLVPKRLILDGVDYLKNKTTGVDLSSKRLYDNIDAGYVVINSMSGWTGEVVYRRTAKTGANGQKILMDTNNSLNDFKVSTTIKPREYDEE